MLNKENQNLKLVLIISTHTNCNTRDKIVLAWYSLALINVLKNMPTMHVHVNELVTFLAIIIYLIHYVFEAIC